MRTAFRVATVLFAACGWLIAAEPAAAAPPANDPQSSPQAITLPADVGGTTAESTVEPTEPPARCGATRGTVWFAFTASADERVVARLQAAGDLDAQVSVFQRQRSQTQQLDCDATDADGLGQVSFTTRARGSYLIRVEQRANSVPGTFRLAVFRPQPAPRAPGARLSPRGVRGVVDSVENTADAYSARLREGRSYRVNLAIAGDRCASLGIFAPGTRNFESAETVKRAPCDGYVLFTPERSGTYSFLVSAAARSRTRQPYHLQVASASSDDTAPGLSLRNFARVRGALNGRTVDVVDLYRFDVTSRSELTLGLGTRGGQTFDLILLNDRGRRVTSERSEGGGVELRRELRPGRYFAVVRSRNGASGRYTLRRVSRAITRTSIAIAGGSGRQLRPGTTTTIAVRVTPAVAGPVTVVIERFDPLEGYQFLRRVRLQATAGRAAVSFRPPAPGRYRARATFNGTRGAARSESGTARVLVAGPLQQ
jgi:hypothetical protein